MKKTERSIGCKIYNHLPWHCADDISDFFGIRFEELTKKVLSPTVIDWEYLKWTEFNTKANRIVTVDKMKHYSFSFVAELCLRLNSPRHTERYKKFLQELGIVFPNHQITYKNEFASFLARCFKKVLEIKFDYKVGEYQVDVYIEKLGLAIDQDRVFYNKISKKEKLKRQKRIEKVLGVELIEVSVGDEPDLVNTIIQRMLLAQKTKSGKEK